MDRKALCIVLSYLSESFYVRFCNVLAAVKCPADCLCDFFPCEANNLTFTGFIIKNQFNSLAVMITEADRIIVA